MKRAMTFIFFFVLLFPGKSQTNTDGTSPQFLYPGFSMTKVRMKNGQVQSIILNYNTVSEKMVYQKDGKLYDVVNPEMIDTVFLQNSKFVPVGKVFYEVLLNAPIPLFVMYKGDLIPPGAVAGYGGTSQVSNTKSLSSVDLSMGRYNLDLPPDFKVRVDQVYLVRIDSNMISFRNEKQFLKIFSGKEAKLKQFIKQNRIRFDNFSDVEKLVWYCNEK